MRLRITEVNFTIKHEWLFKLKDESGDEFYIMNESFYKRNFSDSPITKHELDYFDKGLTINAIIKEAEGKKAVFKII